MSQLGMKLRQARVEACLTIGDLSLKSEVHGALIGKLERGYIPARCLWFSNLERALELPLGLLDTLLQKDIRTNIYEYSQRELRQGRKDRIQQEKMDPNPQLSHGEFRKMIEANVEWLHN